MLVSSHFKISRTRADDWFDTILDADTELFVDPFLVFREKRGFWGSCPQSVISARRATAAERSSDRSLR